MKIGILGASRIAIDAVVGPARSIDGVEVSGIASRDPKDARSYAAKHAIPHAYADYGELMADPAIDLIYVGTPPSTHADLALAAVRAGKPALVEKPFSLTSQEARCVYDASSGDLSGLPPILSMTSTRDQLLSQTVLMDLALRRAGVGADLRVYEGMMHAFWALIECPETEEALAAQADFLARHLRA